ncbi:MAG: diguanylate cyclase [Chloroflexi bacterium]|nr:diguanylate cyclase [Chloroflexota bacterium]
MTSQQLMTIIFIAILVNAVLIGLALVAIRNSRGRRPRPDFAREAAGGPASASNDIVDRLERVVIAGGAPDGPARPMGDGAGTSMAFGSTTVHTSGAAPAVVGDDDDAANGFSAADDPQAIEDAPPPIELGSPIAWRHAVDDEVVRSRRYHRPATVILVELDGFERFTDRLGEAAGRRLVNATARALAAQARASDRCTQLGRGRFGVLLPETDDIKAINFAERVRSECDRWLDAGEVSLRVAIGWALLDPAQGTAAALEAAERQLDAERRHRTRSAP